MIWFLLIYFSVGLVWTWALKIRVFTNGGAKLQGKTSSTIDRFMKIWVALGPLIAWPLMVFEVHKMRGK